MKNYINPDIKVLRLSVENQLMAGSTDYKTKDVTLSSDTENNDNAYSRVSSIWDDEIED